MHPAYGPQLGDRLHLSHTKQNLIGLSGNCTAGSSSIRYDELIESPPQLVVMRQDHLLGSLPTREDRVYPWPSLLCCF